MIRAKLFLIGLPVLASLICAAMWYTGIEQLASAGLIVGSIWASSLMTTLAIYRHSKGEEATDQGLLEIYQVILSGNKIT